MLLMIEPDARQPLPPTRHRVAPGTALAVDVAKGQLLKIGCLDAGAVAVLYGFAKDDPSVWLSVHHTRVFSNSYVLSAGMRLVSNRRRPLMVLGKDSVGIHDLLMPASTSADLRSLGEHGATGCVEAVQAELDRRGIAPPRFPDPVNLFMNVQVREDGRLVPLPCSTRPGDFAIFRVLRDMVFVVSTCDTAIEGNRGGGALEIGIAEDLLEL